MSSLHLKPQIPAFTVPQLSEAMDVILQRAHELKVIIFVIPLPELNHDKDLLLLLISSSTCFCSYVLVKLLALAWPAVCYFYCQTH